ncbi:MAG: 3-oxoacyl-ACP reductase FabG [Calditrichia bacterium]
MKRLADKVSVITGAARGIGRATAEIFAKEGSSVVLWDVDEAGLADADAQLAKQSSPHLVQTVNVADSTSVQSAVEEIIANFGQIDILINNAGITRDARLVKMSHEEWQQVLDVNLGGVFNTTKAIAPYMIERNYGRIINTSSIVGLYGNFGQTNYVATKSGVIGMTKVWARELGRKGITVNAVAPGFIETEMVKTIPAKVIEEILAKTPMQRMGQPSDIANGYLYLASDEAGFVNGAVLSIDGGSVG